MDFQGKQIAPPKSWESFEELCLVLFREIWQDPMTQKNGRQGQQQHGVDIFGIPDSSGSFYGIQCKGKDAGYSSVLTISELNCEVAKAKFFTPTLKDFIIATTAPRNVHLQKRARELSASNIADGSFSVHVLAWEDIQSLLAEHTTVIERFYPEHAFNIPALIKAVQALPSGEEVKAVLPLVRQHATSAKNLLTSKMSPWRPITFAESRDLGPALLGRALGPSDATACPRLIEADVIVCQLLRAFSARLVGVPGSGKSVSAYQAALTLVEQGWLVVRLNNPRVDYMKLESPDCNPTLFLVDDAHLMDQDVLRELEDQASSTRILLTVHTALDRTTALRGTISMDGARAVRTIASTLKASLKDTLAAVQRADDRVGEGWLDEDLGRRIDAAQASSQFPWQFCFILGGGWRRTTEAADASRVHGADLILAIAAAKQIASRDAETDNVTILELGLLAGLTTDEIQKGLTWLVQERLLLSENDLRCPHQRFSAAIIGRIYSGMDATKRNAFTRVCSSILKNKTTMLAGAKALIHELRFTRFELPWIYELESFKWLEEATQSVLLARCWEASTAEDRMYACMIIAELHVKLKWQDLLPSAQIKQLGEWISEAVHPTGLGLGWLLNDIYNDDKFLAAKIVSTAIPVAVAQIASSANSTTAYTISEMINRMALACSKEWKESVRVVLDRNQIIQTVAQWPNGENLASLSKYCLALSLYDTELAFEVLQATMPILQQALAKDPITTFHEIEDIAWHLLRVWDPLGIYVGKLAPDHRQINLTRALCKLIDYKKTAARISASPRRDLQMAAYFLGFFRQISHKKAATLCRELNWNRLDVTIGAEWSSLTHDSTSFICQAACDEQSLDIVVSIIKRHLPDIKIMPSRIAVITPDLACAVVDQGGVIALSEDMALSWKIPAYIVQKFGELRPDLVSILITPHEAKAAMSLQSKQINIFDNADIFLRKLNEFAPDSLSRILTKIDHVAAETAWTACLAKGGKAGRTSAYLVEHCLTLPNELGQVAKRLRQRFPKASISK